MLYFAHRIHSKNDARIFLLEDMRVDEDTLADLDFSLVNEITSPSSGCGDLVFLSMPLFTEEPPPGFDTEVLPVLEPIPFNVRIFSLPDLFAGKMHYVLCRQWRSRVKGRDWYDMIWFLQNGVPVNLFHLEERMRQSGHWTKHRSLGEREFLALYREKIDRVDFSRAVEDVQPFLQDPREIEAWGPDFFRALTGHFRFA